MMTEGRVRSIANGACGAAGVHAARVFDDGEGGSLGGEVAAGGSRGGAGSEVGGDAAFPSIAIHFPSIAIRLFSSLEQFTRID